MKLSAKQAKLFFRRAQRRFKVSNDFIHRNMTAMLKFIQYAITPRIILKRKLIRKRNRVFLRHNYLRKLIFDPTKLKKRRHDKRLHSQWSKRLVLHLRRHSVIEYVEEEETTATAVLIKKDVSEQLKEQLELLKSGKRIVPLLEEPNNSKQTEINPHSKRLSSIDMIPESQNLVPTKNSDENNLQEMYTNPIIPLLTAVHITDEEFKASADTADKRNNGNFLDMLMSKVKHKTAESGDTEISLSLEKSMEPPKQYNKVYEKEVAETEERENSNSSSDFFGFEDNERVLGNFPGMLSTPLVRKRGSNSAFVSETLNAYMRDNSLESSASVNYPQRRTEDGQVLSKSIPPKLDMPALPEGLQGLRTVAERRTFLQRTKNTKYCIINNVATIFRELQKRTKGHRIYKQAIESVMASNSVPMTRQGWKAAAWLLTDIGNYYCQTITINEEHFRLYGGRGNFRTKFRKPHSNLGEKVISVCPKDCADRISFRSFRPIRTPEKRSKLNDSSKKLLYKPCPLSQKILQHSRDEESVFDSLDIVRMPEVELEVFPQLQKPLSEAAKKYLHLILPYEGISREWAEFSVSTLLESQNIEFPTKSRKSFTFKLPYANDRNHLIIRRVYNRSEDFDDHFDNSSFSFRKQIDQEKVNGKPPDLLSIECADILTDMLNSVAIACSENAFIKDDPDNIDQYVGNENITEEKFARKTEQHHQQSGMSNKKQSRLLMELKRLNATVIDAATSKSEEDRTTCGKECCKLGCVCASLSERTTVRQHCGKQRCVLECKCKCPSIMRLEIDGRKITTEDAFMLRRQATAKLARVEKEFTSTIVLTGSETLLINESQYDKKRRCTKIPKRYGDFVDHDDPDLVDSKPSIKRTETIPSSNVPLEPVLINDKIYNRLKHTSVKLKKLHDIKDLAPWCMVHMLYKCFCKGQSTFGNPIVIEKHEEISETTSVDESILKNRTLYSFETEERKRNTETCTSNESENYENSETSEASETVSDLRFANEEKNKIERRGRISDNHYIEVYMNAKANHCRRVVPIPKNIYKRRNKKRVAHIQLYIAENESDKTRLSLNEHVLRSVYYHKDINANNRKSIPEIKEEDEEKSEDINQKIRDRKRKDNLPDGDNKQPDSMKKRRMSVAQSDKGSSLLLVNHYKDSLKREQSSLEFPTPLQIPKDNTTGTPPKFIPGPLEQITIPKISQIFSLNTGIVEMETDTRSPVPMPIPEPEPASAIDIAQAPSDDMALAHGVSSDAFKNVFKQVIKNMNNLVSKKMQDIDMALRRESKAIPAPNAEILCIIRWNNFLEAYLEGFVYLWEVRTSSLTFIAATIKPIMPLVMNALSVVNIQTISRNKLPLLGRMLIDRKRSASAEGLAVVMQGQKMYWIVKGFLRPDKTRICPKPTPETHPLLTRKINVLCRLLINNQFNEHKKRQDALQTYASSDSPQMPASSINDITDQPMANILLTHSDSNTSFQPPNTSLASSSPFSHPAHPDQNTISLKLKVLPMQRNISDQATSILEQMVSQAYGLVRTNITFRKIRNSELFEIFPPAKLNSNHHWLVLDISNDFSHIFIPELKDLLTLDRIQKVMAYALAKNRIVKMQFSQKSLFNAYVTPKSQRKLYFGPYRQSVTPPKLVLLQSVDGQMMLREVYESRHNIIPKTFSTTAFWVVQKCGRIFLDVEQEQIVEAQVNEREMENVHNISFRNHCNIQQTCIDGVEEITQKYQSVQVEGEHLTQTNVPVQYQQEHQNQAREQNLQHYKIQQGSQVEQSKELHQISEVLSDLDASKSFKLLEKPVDDVQTVSGMEKENPDKLNSTNHMDDGDNDDDDDDCMIVDSETPAPLDVAPPILCTASDLSSKTVLNPGPSADHHKTNSERINYTISYAGENSSLVVIQNECDRASTVMPDVIRNTFTILSNDPQPSEESLNLSVQPKSTQPMPINTIFNLSSEDCRPLNLKPINDINSGEIILTFPTNDPNTNLSIPAEHLSNFSVGSIASNPNKIKPVDNVVLQSENEKETTEIRSNNSKINKISMKLNKNITITKLKPEVERNPSVQWTYSRNSLPTLPQKPAPMTFGSSSRFVIPSQKQKTNNPKATQIGQVIRHVQQKPIVAQLTSQVLRQQTPPTTFSQTEQRPMIDKITGNSQQHFVQRGQSGLVVRTPSTINTIIRAHQQNFIRSSIGNSPVGTPELNSISSGVRLRTPTAQLPKPTGVHLNNHLSTSSPNQKHVLKRAQNTTTAKQILNSVKSGTPVTELSKQPQCDPLHLSGKSTKIAANNISQPMAPNGVKTVLDTPKQNTIQGHIVLPSIGAVGIKRNAWGTPISRTQFRVQPIQKMPTKIISSTTRAESFSVKQTSLVKGIPIELPRLKKFAIVTSPTQNTTIITPPETNCKNDSEASTISSSTKTDESANGVPKTLIASGMNKNLSSNATVTASTTTLSSTATKVSSVGSSNASAEYGYFHANIEGLPKFVVKRVGEDFLIKVPNFNGILKLAGLSTVHNYLNQYTTQKCGKTNEEIANLKWTFKIQDRSKLNIINKSNSSHFKSGNNSLNMQKPYSLKRSSNEHITSSSISPAPTTKKGKPQSASPKPFEPNDSIDLSEDV